MLHNIKQQMDEWLRTRSYEVNGRPQLWPILK